MDPPTNIQRTAKGEVRIEEPTRAERLVGRRAAESRATVPDFELATVVDMSATVAARRELRAAAGPEARRGPRVAGTESVPSLTATVVRACALALREHPRANGAYRDGHFELHARVNVGVAIMTGDSFAV